MIAALAGGDQSLVIRTALSMTVLQLGIGTVNDVVDAPFDAGLKPGKPIPSGLVALPAATALAIVLFSAGVFVAATASPLLAGLAVVVIGIGLAYDLRLKGTAWSWLPFAVGIPVLPAFGWVAARGHLEPFFIVLVPAAVLAGAALAISNSLVDTERDRAAGRASISVALGDRSAWLLGVVLVAVVWLLAVGSAVAAALPELVPAVVVAGIPALTAAAAGRRPDPTRRELAWRLEAVAIAVLALAWLLAVVGSGTPS